jgi:hypothetical protein
VEHGFEFVAAQSKKREVEDEPSRETMRGSRKIMSNPSTDQKKVRRAMTKKANHPAAPQHTVPEQRHPHGARPFPCKVCQGWGQDAYGQPCFRCHGTGMTTTSALDDASGCRLCGGALDGDSGTVKCQDCKTEHELQGKNEKAAFKSAIARRASEVLNTPEENQ